MTAVPKPLKLLSPRFPALQALFVALPPEASAPAPAGSAVASSVRELFADMLSVLGMTLGPEEGARETLKYKLLGNVEDCSSWGHEYVRHLSGEVGAEWCARVAAAEAAGAPAPQTFADLLSLVRIVVPFNLTHNAEHEACDLLLEIGHLELLLDPVITAGVLAPSAPSQGSELSSSSSSSAPAAAAAVKEGGAAVVAADGETTQLPYARVCAYLLKCASYTGDEDDARASLTTAYTIYLAHGAHAAALLTALRLGGEGQQERLAALFAACAGDAGMRRQLAHILGRQRVNFSTGEDALDAIIGNTGLSVGFAALARELDVVESKSPEDVYKSHLSGEARRGEEGVQLGSARGNLANSYVNGFVNAGSGRDKLLTPPGAQWPFQNKDHGKTAAVASLGLLHLWNDTEMSALDKYLESRDDAIKAGALLGVGLIFAGTRNPDADAAYALLGEVLEPSPGAPPSAPGAMPITGAQRAHALLGLGLAYAGSQRSDVAELASPYLQDAGSPHSNLDVTAMAAVCVGLVYCGAGALGEVYSTLIADRLMSAGEVERGVPIMRHTALGLGLIYMGRGEEANLFLEDILPAMGDTPLGLFARNILLSCAYAGTGNAMAIQRLLRVCAEHPEMEDREKAKAAEEAAAEGEAGGAGGGGGGGGSAGASQLAGGGGAGASSASSAAAAASAAAAGGGAGGAGAAAAKVDDTDRKGLVSSGKYLHQSVAVLGLGLVAAGEDLSADMAGRMADHLLSYGDASVRRAVPLALALVHLSDPEYSVVDVLSKLSHDHNEDCAQAAILALGLVGAGTNNSRIAGLLRTLSIFYKTEPNTLFVTRIAQGLLHMGKVSCQQFCFFDSPSILRTQTLNQSAPPPFSPPPPTPLCFARRAL
jgi:26S proteasome regulatory subunit N1